MSRLLSLFAGLFGHKRSSDEYKTAAVYRDLRKSVLAVNPGEIGLTRSGMSGGAWGAIMETGYPEAVATLVALADGTVSLYFSNGGGVIGLGAHEGPKRASQAFLEFAPKFVHLCQLTIQYPLPRKGHTRFYIMTFDGIFTVESKDDDLGYNRHAMSPLFHKAHELITELRLVDEKLRVKQAGPPN